MSSTNTFSHVLQHAATIFVRHNNSHWVLPLSHHRTCWTWLHPVSLSWTSISKLLRLSSVVSVLKKLGTIQDMETHQTTASNNDCKSEILATDATTNTSTQNNTTNTAAVVSTAPQNTDVSMDQFLVTGINVSLSPPSYPINDLEITCINPDLEEDFKHNIGNEANTQNVWSVHVLLLHEFQMCKILPGKFW